MENKEIKKNYDLGNLTGSDGQEFPAQELTDKTWVLIHSNSAGKSTVYLFNNENKGEDDLFDSFKDWVECSIEQIFEDKIKVYGNKNETHIETSTFFTNDQGVEDHGGWGYMEISDEGVSSDVIHCYNGGLTEEKLVNKVERCYQGCGDMISDHYDGIRYDEELARERMFRP